MDGTELWDFVFKNSLYIKKLAHIVIFFMNYKKLRHFAEVSIRLFLINVDFASLIPVRG
jgi:hypothetical protein